MLTTERRGAAMDLIESDGAHELESRGVSLTRSTGRMVGIVVGMIVVLLALPLAVVLLVSGHLPVTGIFVSSMLLFAVVWIVMLPRAQG